MRLFDDRGEKVVCEPIARIDARTRIVGNFEGLDGSMRYLARSLGRLLIVFHFAGFALANVFGECRVFARRLAIHTGENGSTGHDIRCRNQEFFRPSLPYRLVIQR